MHDSADLLDRHIRKIPSRGNIQDPLAVKRSHGGQLHSSDDQIDVPVEHMYIQLNSTLLQDRLLDYVDIVPEPLLHGEGASPEFSDVFVLDHGTLDPCPAFVNRLEVPAYADAIAVGVACRVRTPRSLRDANAKFISLQVLSHQFPHFTKSFIRCHIFALHVLTNHMYVFII